MSSFRTRLAGPIALSFDVVAHPVIYTQESEPLECPECQGPLDLHQPDENQPTKLVGTCFVCSKWFLVIDIENVCMHTLLVELPCAERIREHFEASNSQV
jgi:hypothetical protein